MAAATNIPDVTTQLEAMIPGYSSLVSQAGSTIGNLLAGTPSPGTARNAAATFGVANGLGNDSGFANRYGYDLYNTLGQQRQQTGLSDLNSLLGATSSATTGQQNVGLGETSAATNQQSVDQQGLMDQVNALLNLFNAGFGGGSVSGVSGAGASSNPFANLNSASGVSQSYTPSTSSYAYL